MHLVVATTSSAESVTNLHYRTTIVESIILFLPPLTAALEQPTIQHEFSNESRLPCNCYCHRQRRTIQHRPGQRGKSDADIPLFPHTHTRPRHANLTRITRLLPRPGRQTPRPSHATRTRTGRPRFPSRLSSPNDDPFRAE